MIFSRILLCFSGLLGGQFPIYPNKLTKASKGYRYYGYQWWLGGPPYKSYYAQGIFGQMIWIDPPTQTVIAMHSAQDKAWTPEADQHKFALLTAIMIKLYNL